MYIQHMRRTNLIFPPLLFPFVSCLLPLHFLSYYRGPVLAQYPFPLSFTKCFVIYFECRTNLIFPPNLLLTSRSCIRGQALFLLIGIPTLLLINSLVSLFEKKNKISHNLPYISPPSPAWDRGQGTAHSQVFFISCLLLLPLSNLLRVGKGDFS